MLNRILDGIIIKWQEFLSYVFVRLGTMLFPIVVIYSPPYMKDEVVGLTFTIDKKYANKITELEDE